MDDDKPAKSSITNDQFDALVSQINGDLEERITVKADFRPNEVLIRVKDSISRSESKLAVARDVDLADARRRILRAATDLILLTHPVRKRA